MRFKDKVVILTGATGGIGRVIAKTFAQKGARLVLAARNAEKLQQLAEDLQAFNAEVLFISTDVTQAVDCQNLIQQTIERWHQIDILIANAGQYIRGRVAEIKPERYAQSLAINFYGVVHPVQAVLPEMLARKSGHIVILNSLDAKKGIISDSPYVVAKCALMGFGDVLRQELHGSGVSVTSLFPGRIDTPMIDELEVPWISPKFSPQIVANAVLRGIRKRKAEVIVPGLYSPMVIINHLFPKLVDWVYRKTRIEGWAKK